MTAQIGWLITLAISFLSLIGQLCWPAVDDWRKLPVAGGFGIIRLDGQFVRPPSDANDSATTAPALNEQCIVRLPSHYGTSEERWPLVVFLHGSRQRGSHADNLSAYLQSQTFKFIANGHDLPAIIAAPQCPADRRWEPESVAIFAQEIASKFRVEPARIYLVGCSMGGYGVWRTAAAYPKLFAAAVPMCGGGDPESAGALAAIPIWAFHGSLDDVVPLGESQQMVSAISRAGGHPRFTILDSTGHGICNEVCSRTEMWDWLLDQSLQSLRH